MVRKRPLKGFGKALKPFWPLFLVYGLLLTGFVLVVVGVFAIYWPAGLIVAGVLLFVLCWVDVAPSRRPPPGR